MRAMGDVPRWSGRAAWLGLVVAVGLTGCVSDPGRFPFGALSVTVRPGDTGTCHISPCQVHLVMPAGNGEFRVTGNRIDLGRYPAGQTVNLGDFYAPVGLEIVGAGVPKAYVYIPVDVGG